MWDGIPLVPALTGLFALSEMINLSVKGGVVASQGGAAVTIGRVREGMKAVFRNYRVLFRGSAIGAFVGAIPGVGGTVASFLSYASTVQSAKDRETFGKGNIKGVIAPESANNAKDGGALIPTLAFGIPGSAEMAIFLGVLVQHGLEPGPMLLIEHEGVIFSLILALAAACVLASAVGLSIARQLSMITLVDVHILVPAVVSAALVGVFALHNSIGDVVLAMVFGVIGYLMIRYDYPRITLVIALVLGDLAERSFFQSMIMSDQDWTIFLTRGISGGLFAVTLLILLTPAVRLAIARKRGRKWHAPPGPVEAATGPAVSARVLAPLLVLILSAVYLVWSYSYDPRSRMVPALTGWILIILCTLDVIATTGTTAGRAIASFFAGEAVVADPESARGPYGRIFLAAAWLAVFVAAVALVGFVPVIPVYVALFVILQGRMKVWKGVAASLATTAFTVVVFEWLMEYSIYRGILFE